MDDRLLDQLVDGELPDTARRALLLRLEGEPDGWRRCALAFLEAQSWRATFAPLAVPVREEVRSGDPATIRAQVLQRGPGMRVNRRRTLARLVAVAAGFAVAFALGWA